jgi:two-component system sensor histidine kinase CpxA
MNTVYGRLVLWAVVTVVGGFALVMGASTWSTLHEAGRTVPNRYDRVLIEHAVAAWLSGGAPALRQNLSVMEHELASRYFLTDASGRDLLTGQPFHPSQDHHLITNIYPSADRQFRFIEESPREFRFRATVPYHTLLLIAVALLGAALGANLASPLRRLAQTVDRFGAGDLSARVNSTRKDEIGDVSRAFDRMAGRIATLLTAERRLLQDISHELRSPLARLAFAAELARTAPDREAAIERLKKEITRLTDLVGGLIQVTRAEGDPDAARRQVLRLDELVTTVVEDCRLEANQRGCAIEWSAAADFTMRGDPEMLRRAVENVLRNAIRYTAAGSSVEVSLQAAAAGTARMAIRDYGPGVPDEALEKIFTPFFRLDDARDSATGGVGLGLAIAQRAIALHHGRVWAEAANPGLRVFLEVPVA